MPGKLKFVFILIFSSLIICASTYADESLINKIFFDDFVNLGSSITADPVKSLEIAAGTAIATDLLMVNDKYFSHEIEAGKNNFNDNAMNVLNNFGDGLYVLAGDSLLFAFGGDNERKNARKVVEAVLVSGAIAYVAKVVVGRERPSVSSSPYVYKMFSFADSSMPSGHTTAAFAWATIIGDNYNIGYITYPAAFLCGIARIYKNAHWPSDVLLGGLIGTVTGKSVNFENQNISISIKNRDNVNFADLDIKF